MPKPSVIAVIPARKGSKGLAGKNILPIAGKPMIGWSIEAALQCKLVDRVVVSTDCHEIAAISLKFGAEVPFFRPADLAADLTPGVDVVLHAINEIPNFDIVVLLQPTSPLRTAVDITQALQAFIDSDAASGVSVCLSKVHPNWMKRISEDGMVIPYERSAIIPNRQQLESVYSLNGAIYLARCDSLKQSRSFHTKSTLAYVMPPERSFDVDSAFDLSLCDLILRDRPITSSARENR
jgi:CMP-N,N'-diacetyllegionaminic acid synthase